MARAYRGPYARPSSRIVPYATAAVWGTGIDAVHSYYGEGPPIRMLGREGTQGSSPVGSQYPRGREYQQPGLSSGDDPREEMTWGYPVDYDVDSFGMGADSSPSTTAPAVRQYMDDRPSWDTPAESDPLRADASTMTPWNVSGVFMRKWREGSHRFRVHPHGPISAEPSNSLPNETVSEGWENKATSFVAYADPSADAQIFVQTSMRQRFGTRDNRRAQLRATDDERSTIASRVKPMIEKVYSGGERHYDMFPFQIDQINRPFRFRTAGVGPAGWMTANEYNALTPVQRTPPPDPAAGVPEVQTPESYGYTGEDTMYYG
jgi:hypothetical protein